MPHPPLRQKEEQKKFLLIPIDLGPEKKQGNLIHYGTGIRGPPRPTPQPSTSGIGMLRRDRIDAFAFDSPYFTVACSLGLALMYFFMRARISSSFSGMGTFASWLRR
jgi:hypothetical protein